MAKMPIIKEKVDTLGDYYGRFRENHNNAPMESFFATLKTELVHHCRFETREQAQAALFDYMEIFYNRQRIHSALGYGTPADFESFFSFRLIHCNLKNSTKH